MAQRDSCTVGVKGQTRHANGGTCTSHRNTKSCLGTSTYGVSDEYLKCPAIDDFGRRAFESVTPVLAGLWWPSLGFRPHVG